MGYVRWNSNNIVDTSSIIENTIENYGTFGVANEVKNHGDTYGDDEIALDSIHTKGEGEVGIYWTLTYQVINGANTSKSGTKTITQYEYDYLVYIVVHEAGGLYVDNPESQMLAVASTYMNLYERNNGSDFAYIMWFCCTQWATDNYTRYTLTNELKSNVYSILDFSEYTAESISIATKSVNTVLEGTRVTSPTTTSWVGDGNYNTFGD